MLRSGGASAAARQRAHDRVPEPGVGCHGHYHPRCGRGLQHVARDAYRERGRRRGASPVDPDASNNTASATVTVLFVPPPPPPPVVIVAPEIVGAFRPTGSRASVPLRVRFRVEIANGTITAGQGTPRITLRRGSRNSRPRCHESIRRAASFQERARDGRPFRKRRLFYTVPACRLIDTRGPVGPLGGPALAPAGALDRILHDHRHVRHSGGRDDNLGKRHGDESLRGGHPPGLPGRRCAHERLDDQLRRLSDARQQRADPPCDGRVGHDPDPEHRAGNGGRHPRRERLLE